MPVPVYVDDSMPVHTLEGVEDAVEQWNDSLDGHYFDVVHLPAEHVFFLLAPRGSITVSQGELGTRLVDVSDGQLSDFRTLTLLGIADLLWYEDAEMYHCMVILDPELNERTARPVAVHELGHCLGLPHSADPRSIMYRDATMFPGQYLTQEDLARAHEAVP